MTRAETLRRPEVAAIIDAICDRWSLSVMSARQTDRNIVRPGLSCRPTPRAPTTGTGRPPNPAPPSLLHGFGEHSGVYHRYGFALNAAGIDLGAVD